MDLSGCEPSDAIQLSGHGLQEPNGRDVTNRRMVKPRFTNRRTVLKSIGAGVVGGTVLTGSATARGNVVSQIDSNGHWAWFPLGQEKWGRQKHPYDFREGNSRWMAEPARGGSVRALAKNITTEDTFPNRNTGFDIHLGPIGDLDSITFTSRTVQTQSGSEALLFIGLYLDTNKNGEFFHWENVRGDRESAIPGPGGDDEGLLFTKANGQFTIDDFTEFFLIPRGIPGVSLGELKAGDIDGIDGETPSALYIGVGDPDPGTSGAEEAVIENVTIQEV